MRLSCGGSSSFIGAVGVIFVVELPDGSLIPTGINGDNYMDTALNEVYHNDNFGDPNGTRPGNPWGINVNLPGMVGTLVYWCLREMTRYAVYPLWMTLPAGR